MSTDGMTVSKRPLSEDEKTSSVRKRKYRKHPKPDQNAPKKPPPSAYHLFALEQGETLRRQGYSFEDVARETGAMWRSLSLQTANGLETKTTQAKSQYRNDLAVYKKSTESKAYQEYLKRWMAKEEAKKKNTNHSTELPTPPPRTSPPTTIGSSSPSSLTSASEELSAHDWSSLGGSQPCEDASFMALPEDWFVKPEMSPHEQMTWKWSADFGVTLAPDPLFPMYQTKGADMFGAASTLPLSLTISPSMLTSSNSLLPISNPYTFYETLKASSHGTERLNASNLC